MTLKENDGQDSNLLKQCLKDIFPCNVEFYFKTA